MVYGGKKKLAFVNKIFALKHVEFHIWSVWVVTHLKQLLLDVSDALGVWFLDLNMKNEPGYHIIMVHRGKQITKTAFVAKYLLCALEISYMVSLCGYLTQNWSCIKYQVFRVTILLTNAVFVIFTPVDHNYMIAWLIFHV